MDFRFVFGFCGRLLVISCFVRVWSWWRDNLWDCGGLYMWVDSD